MEDTSGRIDGVAGDVSVWRYLAILLRRRGVLVWLPLAVGFLTATLSLMSTRQYRASASFTPQEPVPTGATSGLSQLANQFGLATPRGANSSPQFYADLIKSRDILRAAVQSQYSLDSSQTGTLTKYFGLDGSEASVATADAIRRLRAMIVVTPDRATSVVSFEVMSESPSLSGQIAQTLLDLLTDYNLRRRQSQARSEREFLEKRLADAQQNLDSAEGVNTDFHRQNRDINGSPALQAEAARLLRKVTLRQQLFLTLSQNLELAKIEEVRSTPVLTILERPQEWREPVARGTIRKAVVGTLVGAFFAVLLVFGLEFLSSAKQGGGADFQEFATEVRRIRLPWGSSSS